ncbi:unnamed protein product [Clonostachys solani]|uniref:GED domain-containing protein n=1 Tax=Clonostachys solani TaxID=160281 RepID=A0A9N9ZGA8_9HYPO|nr:unnamed protein product [Clonostachys solani]
MPRVEDNCGRHFPRARTGVRRDIAFPVYRRGQGMNSTWSRSEFDVVKERIRRSMGPRIVVGHVQPYGYLRSEILEVVNDILKPMVDHIAIQETASKPFKNDLEVKLRELLTSHIEGHPITYNHYLTDTVQTVQEERRRNSLGKQFLETIGPEQFDSGQKSNIYPARVFKQLGNYIKVDMERSGSELVVDYMEAYFKVVNSRSISLLAYAKAHKKFIDDISVLAAERCLINKLPSLFPSETILDLRDDEVADMATESDALLLERALK